MTAFAVELFGLVGAVMVSAQHIYIVALNSRVILAKSKDDTRLCDRVSRSRRYCNWN